MLSVALKEEPRSLGERLGGWYRITGVSKDALVRMKS